MKLAKHTEANREFFERASAPTKAQWLDWIERGIVQGKIIDGKPYIDLNWFAVSGANLMPATQPAGQIDPWYLLEKKSA